MADAGDEEGEAVVVGLVGLGAVRRGSAAAAASVVTVGVGGFTSTVGAVPPLGAAGRWVFAPFAACVPTGGPAIGVRGAAAGPFKR